MPEGYFVLRSKTYGNLVFWRGFLENGSTKPAVDSSKKFAEVYRLSDAKNPPPMKFINVSGKAFNTIGANTFQFYEDVNSVVQYEPNEAYSPEILGQLASIGIEKGKPFVPDAGMKKILTEAVAVGNATARAFVFKSRQKGAYLYPNSAWFTCFIGGSYEFLLQPGVRDLECARPLHILCHRYYSRDGAKAGRPRFTIRCCYYGFRGEAARRRKNLQDSPTAQHPGEGLLVLRRV